MIPVASYCRVSTDKDDQANSFAAQQRYFKEYIDRQPDWELYKVYADEGISGTSTEKRQEFNRMIHDAHMGKFKLIITKEVSRFSRNILDTISFTRELRSLGVGVLFMNNGINTLKSDGEMYLSIMAILAQEESRATSNRVKWGQTRQMERGVVFGTSMLGYDVKDGKLSINPEGAEIARLIFHKYAVEKKGTTVIARELREAGYQTYHGSTNWSNSHIVKILKNEKYVGDLTQKKTFTPDYLTHAKKYNHGEEEMITITNHHEPIISREIWNMTQAELQKRNRHGELGAGHSNRYVFSGKIKCGECGYSFVSRYKKRKDGTKYRKWGCLAATDHHTGRVDAEGNPVGCNIGRMLRDEVAMDILRQGIQSLQMDTDWIIRNVTTLALEAIREGETESADTEDQLQYQIDQLTKKKEAVLDAFFSQTVTKEEMRLMNERYDQELAALDQRMQAVREKQKLCYDARSLADDVRQKVKAIVCGETDSEVFYKNILDHMTVYRGGRVELRLNLLPQKWVFVLDRLHDFRQKTGVSQFDTDVSPQKAVEKSEENQGLPASVSLSEPAVPMSVSRPFSSG
ncbi:recombinase family protein [Dysosmobacter sp.]|uniref:recombinase family protein n=1 Tax=Dysosmobacter sp. TaxID=2591382 RepID=UPI002A9B3943|nr:recombinase family protein [Dysosmobacter sp.]MDY5612135.1 recombinase family protein [Dysosmobacter sp.]